MAPLLAVGRAGYFYPRSPCGERHQECSGSQQPDDFYPRSPCGERRYLISARYTNKEISIHALLAESDEPTAARNDKNNIFLSTLSLRRATRVLEVTRNAHTDFYPRSPCGERLQFALLKSYLLQISIHALLAESD